MSQRVAILDGIRTPFCKAWGVFRDLGADDLGAVVVKELLARCELPPGRVDEVIFGNVGQPAHAANVARVIGLKAGLDPSIIAHTVHRNCASGMQAVSTAALLIGAGEADIIVAGGTESMSQIPLLCSREVTDLMLALAKARTRRERMRLLASVRPRHLKPVPALKLGLTDPVCGMNMGETAETLARDFGITRDEQDAFALESHHKAVAAAKEGRLAEETIPVPVAPDYRRVQEADDGPREQQTIEALRKLKPYFLREAGTVTAGNACPVTDGAAALLLASERAAKTLGLEPIGYLRGWAYAGLEGARMGLGPTYATAKLLERTGMSLDDFDVVELNEAFAAQVIANERAMASKTYAKEHLDRSRALGELDRDRLNVNGGAIALGHPVGASGSRLILTSLKELGRRGGGTALATLCVGGGQGAAFALEAA